MSEFEIIRGAIASARRRRMLYRVWMGFWKGMFVGVSIWVVAVVAFKLLPLDARVPMVGLWAGAGVLVAFVLAAMFKRESPDQVARWIDDRHQLKERLSSAIEFSKDGSARNEWDALILRDASEHARSLDMKKILPLHMPRFVRWAALLLVMGVGLGFVPEYRSAARQQEAVETENMKETGKEMAKVIRQELAERPPAKESVEQALDESAALGDRLTKGKLTKAEALRDLAKMSEKLKQESARLNDDPALKRMQKAARTPSGTGSDAEAEMQKKMDQLRDKLAGKEPDPEQVDDLKQQMEALKQKAASMAGNNSPEAQAARNEIAKAMASLSQQAAELGMKLDSVDAAIEALSAMNTDRFLQEMEAALQDLDEMKQLAQALQQLKKEMAEQIGKDLGEQLEKGQAEMAASTLKEMMKKLQDSGLTKEQLEQLMEEVSEAIDPASPYGEVGKHLQQAAAKMGQGDKAGGSESLAKAAEELEKLMDQFSDMQSLAATMKALQAAQMCVGNCQGWGQNYKPGIGKGGKPGAGVGTWADDTGWSYYNPPNTGLWDNSQFNRPDMEGRGITDRGDAVLNEGLNPDKIKGQFTPGGQMPSITLKGVSIKGQSNLEYEEVASATQGGDRSSQNQDKVPRAYQKAVKAYFDDAE